MSRAQVRDLLGTPMLTDIFHADRWDYVFTIKRPGTEPQQRTIVASFDGDKLIKLDAPGLPSEREFITHIAPSLRKPTPPLLSLTDEQRKALPAPVRADSTAPAITAPTRTYPPLEPV
jgi:outer membrane protein assembly factor BamE